MMYVENVSDVMHSYTRNEDIRDGVLVDVTITAKEAGYKFPVAVTQTLWNRIQDIPKSGYSGNPKGRLWDVLYMGVLAIKLNARPDQNEISYRLILPHVENEMNQHLITYQDLKMVIGPDNDGGPRITIMLPHED